MMKYFRSLWAVANLCGLIHFHVDDKQKLFKAKTESLAPAKTKGNVGFASFPREVLLVTEAQSRNHVGFFQVYLSR